MTPPTHLICDTCWKKRAPLRAPSRDPEMIGTNKIWRECCFCGTLTGSGIFVEEDSANTKCGGEGLVHKGDPAEVSA